MYVELLQSCIHVSYPHAFRGKVCASATVFPAVPSVIPSVDHTPLVSVSANCTATTSPQGRRVETKLEFQLYLLLGRTDVAARQSHSGPCVGSIAQLPTQLGAVCTHWCCCCCIALHYCLHSSGSWLTVALCARRRRVEAGRSATRGWRVASI